MNTTFRKNLEYISNKESKTQKLIQYSSLVKNGELNLLRNTFDSYLMGENENSKEDFLARYNSDLNDTVNTMNEIQMLLSEVDEDGRIKSLNDTNNKVEDLFADLYNKDKNTVTINNFEFDLNILSKKTYYPKEMFKRSMLSSKKLPKLEEWEKLVKNVHLLYSRENRLKYLSLFKMRNDVDKVINTISIEVNKEFEFRESLEISEKDLIDKKIVFNRTMIDGIILDSTYITKDNVIQISNKHKKDIDGIEVLTKVLKESSYINGVELDKDTDLDKVINTINQLEKMNLNLDKKVHLKVRKLGNYRANGLYLNKLKLVCCDLDKPSRLIHELTHRMDYNSNNEGIIEKEKMIKKFGSKINIDELPQNKIGYFTSDVEVIARLGELAYTLEKQSPEYEKSVEENVIRLSKDMETYERYENIYFNFTQWTDEEKLEVKEYFKSLFRLEKNQQLQPIKRGLISYDNKSTLDKNRRTNTKIINKDVPYHKEINKDVIRNIIDLNDDERLMEFDDLTETIASRISRVGNHNDRMSVSEWKDMVEDRLGVLKSLIDIRSERYGDDKIVNNENVFFTKYVATEYVTSNLLLLSSSNTKKGKEFKKHVMKDLENSEVFKYFRDSIKTKVMTPTNESISLVNDVIKYALETENLRILDNLHISKQINLNISRDDVKKGLQGEKNLETSIKRIDSDTMDSLYRLNRKKSDEKYSSLEDRQKQYYKSRDDYFSSYKNRFINAYFLFKKEYDELENLVQSQMKKVVVNEPVEKIIEPVEKILPKINEENKKEKISEIPKVDEVLNTNDEVKTNVDNKKVSNDNVELQKTDVEVVFNNKIVIESDFKNFRHIVNFMAKKGISREEFSYVDKDKVNAMIYKDEMIARYDNNEQDFKKRKKFFYNRDNIESALNSINIEYSMKQVQVKKTNYKSDIVNILNGGNEEKGSNIEQSNININNEEKISKSKREYFQPSFSF